MIKIFLRRRNFKCDFFRVSPDFSEAEAKKMLFAFKIHVIDIITEAIQMMQTQMQMQTDKQKIYPDFL